MILIVIVKKILYVNFMLLYKINMLLLYIGILNIYGLWDDKKY